ncbi:MAG TPA: hypothetical protein PLQ03_11845 [Brevundimonas sp.]|uniref:hypothetical protein n=1 Tax=Brevundimonas sp. TaxID=1871086 RepID=UPI00262B1FAB|nr:hypothetical protein [Brevundimonas sp.]HRO34090.1 hypothetical protein [Brevundimonas sp.]
MRPLAFIAPLAVVTAVAASAQALTGLQPASQPRVSVVIAPAVQAQADDLGQREVQAQADRLVQVVSRALERSSALDGAQVRLTLTDLKPNHPTFEQVARNPGLSAIESRSIGGATVQVELIGADGARQTGEVRYYSHSLAEVRGYSTWQDADRAFNRVASKVAAGRL